MIEDIKGAYLKAGNDNNTLVIPVGLAFEKAYQLRPDIELHKSFDGTHPSLLGTYLAASVVFASIFRTSPIGLEYNYFDEISDKDRDFLTQGGVFTADQIDAYIALKFEEIHKFEHAPHPVEFEMYYSS